MDVRLSSLSVVPPFDGPVEVPARVRLGMGRRPARPLVGAVALLVAACGGADVVSGEPAEHAYDGPLYVPGDAAEHPKAGAGDIVDCQTWGDDGFSDVDVYGEGATADSPEGR
jgi:hypothetical protein